MKKNSSLILLICIIFSFACKKEERDSETTKTGDLLVIVNSYYNSTTTGARVYIGASELTDTVDTYGHVIFRNLPTGTYEIFGQKSGAGKAKSIAHIEGGLDTAYLFLEKNFYGESVPEILIMSPSNNQEFTYGDTVLFDLSVMDDVTKPENLKVQIKDNDKVYFDGYPDSMGRIKAYLTGLKLYSYNMTVEAEDEDFNFGRETVFFKNTKLKPLNLHPIVVDNDDLLFNWDPYLVPSFRNFKIYKISGSGSYPSQELIATIEDPNAQSFRLENFQFSSTLSYFVELNTSISGATAISNQQTVDIKDFISINFTPSKIYFHPSDPIFYAVGNAEHKIIRYNYETGKILGETEIAEAITNTRIGNNGSGNNLYVSTEVGKILIYDLNSMTLKKELDLGFKNYSCIPTGDGKVIATVPSGYTNNGKQYYVVDEQSGAVLDKKGSIREGIVEKVPSKPNSYFVYYGDGNNYDVEFFDVSSSGIIENLVKQSNSTPFSSDLAAISPASIAVLTLMERYMQ